MPCSPQVAPNFSGFSNDQAKEVALDLVATKDLKNQIDDLHRGLHITMETLINQKDYRRAEELLREMDFYLTRLVNDTRVAR